MFSRVVITDSRGGSRILKRGGGCTNEHRRRERFRRGLGVCSPRHFWKFESLKWAFPAFWDKFCALLVLIFASKLHLCKKINPKRGGTGPPCPPPPWIRHWTELADTKSYYKFIIKITNSENESEISKPLYLVIKSKLRSSTNTFLLLIGQKVRNSGCDWLIQLCDSRCPINYFAAKLREYWISQSDLRKFVIFIVKLVTR